MHEVQQDKNVERLDTRENHSTSDEMSSFNERELHAADGDQSSRAHMQQYATTNNTWGTGVMIPSCSLAP
jgi:hypothetical protein